MPSRVLGQSSNWQTSSNFHQRQPTNASLLSQAKSAFLQQSSQPKNISPLKFFAPVQIIAPTVYVNSSGNDANNNTLYDFLEPDGTKTSDGNNNSVNNSW